MATEEELQTKTDVASFEDFVARTNARMLAGENLSPCGWNFQAHPSTGQGPATVRDPIVVEAVRRFKLTLQQITEDAHSDIITQLRLR